MRSSTELLRSLVTAGALGAIGLWGTPARADLITDWNQYAVEATKGFSGSPTAPAGVTLDSNLSSRIEAIAAQAVFDAVNAIDHFSRRTYHYADHQIGSAPAAAATAAHDVLLGTLPNPAADTSADARWGAVRAWLDTQLASDLAALDVAPTDGGIVAGKVAAAAALAARTIDGSTPVTSYGAALTPTTNPGRGLWRQTNSAPGFVNPATGAPTGFDAAGIVIQGRPAIDLNWRDLQPLALTAREVTALARRVPLSPAPDSPEFRAELAYVIKVGRDTSTARTADQTEQALYYKQDAEIFVNEAARIASAARHLSLDANARLFAGLASAIADARIAAWSSKYEQKFWRPITAANAGDDGAVVNNYAAFQPLAATPSHPSNTSGHSATGAAAAEILRAFFGDRILPDGAPATLGALPWLKGTNNGTGNTTTREVSTFSQLQLENGASRIYLGVHFGFDNLQGQLLGLAIADAIIRSDDPATAGLRVPESHASLHAIERTLAARPDLYGFFHHDTTARE